MPGAFAMPGDFLGRGWAFPVAVEPGGDILMVETAEDIRQAIGLILETEPGERVMRPDFGSGLRGMVFEPINTTTLALVRHRVEEALIAWEPRIDLVDVVVTAQTSPPGALLIRIDYRILETNTFYNMVYPFYLREGQP
jgi:phage baseplate assembly protein W